jgi:hypothetical protein
LGSRPVRAPADTAAAVPARNLRRERRLSCQLGHAERSAGLIALAPREVDYTTPAGRQIDGEVTTGQVAGAGIKRSQLNDTRWASIDGEVTTRQVAGAGVKHGQRVELRGQGRNSRQLDREEVTR